MHKWNDIHYKDIHNPGMYNTLTICGMERQARLFVVCIYMEEVLSKKEALYPNSSKSCQMMKPSEHDVR